MRLPAVATRPDLALLLLRVGLAFVLLFHGVYKLGHGIAWMRGPLGGLGIPFFVAYGVYVAELLAPVLLAVGLLARLSGLVIAFDMFMAIVVARRADAFKVSPMGGGWAIELEMLIMIVALAIALAGPGRYSLRR